MTLHSPALRYLHFFLRYIVIGRGNSISVASHQDFDVRFKVAISILHQGDRPSDRILLYRPVHHQTDPRDGYSQGDLLYAIGRGIIFMPLETLTSMGILQRMHTTRVAEYWV